jgi:hypothetical protein
MAYIQAEDNRIAKYRINLNRKKMISYHGATGWLRTIKEITSESSVPILSNNFERKEFFM